MTDTTQVRPRFGRFDDQDENSEDGRPTYGDELMVFDGDDAPLDEDRLNAVSASRLVDRLVVGVVLAVVGALGRGPGRWGTLTYIVSTRRDAG